MLLAALWLLMAVSLGVMLGTGKKRTTPGSTVVRGLTAGYLAIAARLRHIRWRSYAIARKLMIAALDAFGDVMTKPSSRHILPSSIHPGTGPSTPYDTTERGSSSVRLRRRVAPSRHSGLDLAFPARI